MILNNLKALCDKMLSFTTAETNDYHIRRDYTTDIPQVNCYMYNLDAFLDVSTTFSRCRSSVKNDKRSSQSSFDIVVA